MKTYVSSAVELLGLLLLVFGVVLFDWRAGVLVGAGVLVLVGFAIDGGTPVKKKPGTDR